MSDERPHNLKRREPASLLTRAFGFEGGWQVEHRASHRAKERERAWLNYQGERTKRQQNAAATPPHRCGGCNRNLPKNATQRGPHPWWCSPRCYHREYARRHADATKTGPNRAERVCACGRRFTWGPAFVAHRRACGQAIS